MRRGDGMLDDAGTKPRGINDHDCSMRSNDRLLYWHAVDRQRVGTSGPEYVETNHA